MASCYEVWGATTAVLTAPPVAALSSASANTVGTVQHLKFTQRVTLVEWGYALKQAAAAPCAVELIDTGTVPATGLTAYVAGDIVRYNNTLITDTPPLTLGTGASGFGLAAGEGVITATRLLDFQWEGGLYIKKQIPLGRDPEVPSPNYLRIRITPTSAVAVSIVPYVIFEV